MSEKALFYFVIVIVVVLVLIGGMVLGLIFKNKKAYAAANIDIIALINEGKSVSLAQLNSFVASKKSVSKSDMTKIAEYFVANYKIPPKKGDVAPKTAQVYMDFISNFTTNKASDAKIISNFDAALKKENPDYGKEIDYFENRGIKRRS